MHLQQIVQISPLAQQIKHVLDGPAATLEQFLDTLFLLGCLEEWQTTCRRQKKTISPICRRGPQIPEQPGDPTQLCLAVFIGQFGTKPFADPANDIFRQI